jgi:hypothetical protein
MTRILLHLGIATMNTTVHAYIMKDMIVINADGQPAEHILLVLCIIRTGMLTFFAKNVLQDCFKSKDEQKKIWD